MRSRALVWLPSDSKASGNSLDEHLAAEGVEFEIKQLPVLRRRYMRPSRIVGYVRDLAATAREIRRLQPELIYCATSAMLPVALCATGTSARRILHCQEIWKGAEGRILGILARSVDGVICISDAVRSALPPAARKKAVVIHNAIPETTKPPTPVRGAEPLKYLIASRWLSWKGHSTLLAAWDAVDPPGHLTILGGPPPLGAAVDVQQMVAELIHPDSVTLVGEVSDIRPYIDDCDVMVVPSDSPEPFGLVAIEAFSRGRGVIASDGGGLAEIVEPGINGTSFPLGDTQALSEILSTVTPETAVSWGSAARRSYDDRFSVPAFHSAIRRQIEASLRTGKAEG
jgi:glycosyltransferase involved in cell wall biosynthesis